jgi:hypothetical protein
MLTIRAFCTIILAATLLSAQEAPLGSAQKLAPKDQKALDGLKGTVQGLIVWSTSRVNSKHDIWIMNADGTDQRALTTTPNNVDWFPRISPDGSKVLFARSLSGWVSEADAEAPDLWDIWTVNIDGTDARKVVEHACWGTWRPTSDSIVFARGSRSLLRSLATADETLLLDADEFFKKKNAFCQEPELSPNGKFLAITMRGSMRETGIYNRETKEWSGTAGGCEIIWWPDNKSVVRVNQGQGNGGTEILRILVDEQGKPVVRIAGLAVPKELKFMDLPGRRSHEYFPAIDRSGTWFVWCATEAGHEHDIADYEVYLWNVTTDREKGPVRLTFHSGNDRWPDIWTK